MYAAGSFGSVAYATSTYTLVIPAKFTVSNIGWNDAGGITANNTTNDFDGSRKLTVTASSDVEFALVNQDNANEKIGYTLATQRGGAATTTWGFSAAELNAAGGTNKGLGVIVEDYSKKPAGTYTDTVTFTAKVETDLSMLTADYTAKNGEILTGTLSGSYKISIADGATVTLNGVTINGMNNVDYKWAGLTCLGDATIILADGTENTVKGFYDYYPGIQAAHKDNTDPADVYTLTIQGNGKLTASSNGWGAGIGGGYQISCGNIVIEGGEVTAIGGKFAAGIGNGKAASCGDINISGGTVEANGGFQAAGIGSGDEASCGTITISGGEVKATGGNYGAGIGSGYQASCGSITITNTVTKVTATKGEPAPDSIGAGNGGSCDGTVTIGGVVTGPINQSTYTYPPQN